MQRGTHLAIGAAALLLAVWGGEQLAAAAEGPTACDGLLPAAVQALVGRGDMAAKLGSADVAEQEFRKALTAAPDMPAILYRLGVLHANSNNEVGAILLLRAYLEAAGAPRRPCVPVPVGQVRQAIQDIEVKVESNASNLFQAAIEALGAVPEEERGRVAQHVVQALALAERWRLAESVARRYPLGMTEAVATQAVIEPGPLQVRMFDLAEKLAMFDPPDSKLTRVGMPPPRGGLLSPAPGESVEEWHARQRLEDLKTEQARVKQDQEDRPKWRVSCQATRLLAVALQEGWGGILKRRGWDTTVRSQELLAREGLPYGDCMFPENQTLLDLGKNGVEVWSKQGLLLKVSYTPGRLWSPTFMGGLGLPVSLVSAVASESERQLVVAAASDESAVSECAFYAADRRRWLDVIQGRLKDAPRWVDHTEKWTSDGLFVDFAGWVQELTPKSPSDRAEALSEGGWRLTQALGDLRACGAGGQK
jgi:hypothetical protein